MLLPLIALARVLNPLEQSATLWEKQAPLLLLYVSFFVLLGVMIYLCVEIDLRGPCTVPYGACSRRRRPMKAGGCWNWCRNCAAIRWI